MILQQSITKEIFKANTLQFKISKLFLLGCCILRTVNPKNHISDRVHPIFDLRVKCITENIVGSKRGLD